MLRAWDKSEVDITSAKVTSNEGMNYSLLLCFILMLKIKSKGYQHVVKNIDYMHLFFQMSQSKTLSKSHILFHTSLVVCKISIKP